ncbi:MAG: methionine biosynthesis protein MetW [Candidatus Gastranaerophilales bacterium]|nr:methionine biosynthesis protein MetW [Candidatus Gastranaerophilales bacterium]
MLGKKNKLNYKKIIDIVKPNSSILDLGTGEGTLLKLLIDEKKCTGLGIEINQTAVIKSLEKGLSIIQGNLDEGLSMFEDKQFDYAILNQTLQSVQKPDFVIREMLRVAKKVIISFPNFAYYKVRFYLFFKGKMPKSKMLPYEWYNTPNIHLLTVEDFFEFCSLRNIKILNSIYMQNGKICNYINKSLANILSEEVIFICSC